VLGFLLIDKPLGITSHDVVNRIRRGLGTRRVGHAGTLDPLATGLLVVAVGPATRFLQYLELEPKEYLAAARFGITTDSQDAEGTVVQEGPVPVDLASAIATHLLSFGGAIEQLPPMYSAVKKAGKALYAYARRGIEVEREPRTVYIDAYDLLEVSGAEARFRIVCSGGTYVRTLIHDLGVAIGCGAHMTGLIRTRAGRFHLSESVSLDRVGAGDLMSLADALVHLPSVRLPIAQVQMIREGRSVPGPEHAEGRYVALKTEDGAVFSMARWVGNRLQPECVISSEALEIGPL